MSVGGGSDSLLSAVVLRLDHLTQLVEGNAAHVNKNIEDMKCALSSLDHRVAALDHRVTALEERLARNPRADGTSYDAGRPEHANGTDGPQAAAGKYHPSMS